MSMKNSSDTMGIEPATFRLVAQCLKDRPIELQEVEATRFQESRHMKVVGLSALHTGRLYPTGIIPGTHFC
jgi:hypothetical protein